jgi:rifampicin phosphotransferase
MERHPLIQTRINMSTPSAPTSVLLSLSDHRLIDLPLGNKALLLAQAAQKGLPVPAGYVLTFQAYLYARSQGWLKISEQQLIAEQPKPLAAFLAQQLASIGEKGTGLWAVRSAFSLEDGQQASMAGYFTSRLNVRLADAEELMLAVVAVWASAFTRPHLTTSAHTAHKPTNETNFRLDILIMPMVAAQTAGVAFTETDFEDDRINYTEGLADVLVSGEVAGQELELAKLRNFERSASKPKLDTIGEWPKRLQMLLRSVRKVFGAQNWDIEWADDGQECWLLQVRPITQMTIRNEAFSFANHKEILPDLPSVWMTDLITACAPGLYAYYRAFDKELPQNRHFIETFRGRPFINLSLLMDTMRIWGLPTKLVTDSIGGYNRQHWPLNLRRLLRKLPVFMRLVIDQQLALPRTRRAIQRIAEAKAKLSPTDIRTFNQSAKVIYTELVTGMFRLTSAMTGPMAILRRLGVLSEHSARHQAISTQIYTDLLPLRALVASSPPLQATLQAGQLPADPAFQDLWQRYLTKHGHRGVFESDISRPRLREMPEQLFPLLGMAPPVKKAAQGLSWKGWVTLPVWWAARAPLSGRERLRYEAMKAFECLRTTLLQVALKAVEAGQLPNQAAIWDLSLAETMQLADGWKPDGSFWKLRQAELALYRACNAPDLFHRRDEWSLFTGIQPEHSTTNILQGMSLTYGQIEGKAWVLQEPAMQLPIGFDGNDTILVARSVDAGWIPTFSCVAGVVVETGGDLSHGSIILREMQLPAITNVAQATARIQTGNRIRLIANVGQVFLLE